MTGTLFCVAAAWLAAGPIASAQERFWLRYRTSRQPFRHLRSYRGERMDATAEPPRGVRLPRFASPKPYFAKWDTPMAPAGHVWLAFDRSS